MRAARYGGEGHPGQETFRDRKRGLNRPVRLSFKGYVKPVRECAHGARAGLFCCALARASELKGDRSDEV